MSGLNKAERLEEMKRLYIQRAYSDIEMAERLGVDRTLIYRDRMELTGDYPIEKDDEGRYHIPRSKLISEIKLNLHEALTLYLAGRKTSRQTRFHQPHTANAVEKLAATLRQPMTERLLKSADRLLQQEKNPDKVKIIETVAQAWVEQRKVRIEYQALGSEGFTRHTISPYLIEPSIWSDSVYVIARSDFNDKVFAFKMERILSAFLSGETFEIPESFDDEQLLKNAWGIWYADRDPVTVKLRFNSSAARRVKESVWHPLEKVEDTEDGGCIWSADVAEWREMLPWIRGWGADVEALEPVELKNNLQLEAQRLAQLYDVMDNSSKNTGNSNEERLLLLWGKTQKGNRDPNEYHPALFHMLDVAFVAKTLLGREASPRWRNSLGKVLGATPESLEDWLPWFIALHDIGKISVPFQEQNDLQKSRLIANGFDLGNRRWKNDPPHGLISQIFIKYESDFRYSEKLLSGLADLAGGHHGWFSDAQTQRDARAILRKEPEEWKELRRNASKLLIEALNAKLPPNIEDINISATGMVLTGFCILCDWLGSDSEVFKIAHHKSLAEYIPESIERAKSIAEKAGFFQKSRSNAGNKFQELFSNIGTPRPLQSAIDEIPEAVLSSPCLAIIEAPTGEGKTEAALALAHRIAQFSDVDEFYYALPTTATSNQMFGRLQEFLLHSLNLSTKINLIHGQAFLFQDDLRIQPLDNGNQDENDAIDWFAPKKRALLAPFGVGTVDQAELAALNVKHVPLRMIGLAGKVLIIDEVHAYDTYMTTVIEMLLQWLSKVGASVILLSATLPKERRTRLAKAYGVQITEKMSQDDSYPSVWVVSQADIHSSNPNAQQPNRSISLDISLSYSDEQVEEKARWLLNAVSEGGCACWMTNTVARAQQIFDAVDKAAPNAVERFLLHAQLPLDERQRREQEITAKFGPASTERKSSIVIGTQVLEQSLDLDFDVMASDLAPVDLLLQRAGRLHRHTGRKRPFTHREPRLYINAERDEKGDLSLGVNRYVYAPYILYRTWEALQNRSEISLPIDYRPLIEFVYEEKEPDADHPLRDAWDKLQQEQNTAVEKAQLRIVPSPHPNDSFSGPLSRMRFKESETEAGWTIAKTRLGEESITIIPLEREGEVCKAIIDGESVEFSIKQKISHELQIKLLRRSIRVSNRRGVNALKSKMFELSAIFKEASLLKEALPLFLTESKASFLFEKETVTFLLDPKLGLVINFQKGV
jgi:CRISPR-associated endonuclease/helicase Cas3